ncbi:MAG: glycosyltransferase family 4 protein [Isosphaeraceae bacterium]|nr:glycosyltransferase family 4 protein [Isosphaeraceae bacterium]
MAEKRRKKVAEPSAVVAHDSAAEARLPRDYRRACRLVKEGRSEEARRLYGKLGERDGTSDRLRALVRNDTAVVEVLAGRPAEACKLLREALEIDAGCEPARLNLGMLGAGPGSDGPPESASSDAMASRTAILSPRERVATQWSDEGERSDARAWGLLPVRPHPDASRPTSPAGRGEREAPSVAGGTQTPQPLTADVAKGREWAARSDRTESRDRVRVAILSFLFNWPSTGGGNIHTVELGRFLSEAGYQVKHVYARYPAWGIGRVEGSMPFPSEGLEFRESDWNVPAIQERFRRAVDGSGADCVLITDAWNMKPLLAEAVRGYPYFLRFQALECLCPLNNLRLLARGPEEVEQCPRHQLATAEFCHRCVAERGRHSGQLHQVERALAGVGTPEYERTLRRALDEADAVLVLNPLTEAILSPFARRIRVVPWGMDPERFPWPPPEESPASSPDGVVTLFMAAVTGEFIKGFHILHEACRRLRQSRTDFELVVTFDPPGRIDEFTRSVGWVSQEELPRHYRAADLCVVPTIAQEGLSRTSVEAMASGRPVIASRIGGLPFTVSDGGTGLLFEPGDADDLARKIAMLLDDPPLRKRMGLAGRRRFEREFTWETVIKRYYVPLLKGVHRQIAKRD